MISPLFWQAWTTFGTSSSRSRMGASISPFPLIFLILGCTNNFRKRASFSGTLAIKFLRKMVSNVARAAAAMTGFPPKVVMCPKLGFCVNVAIDAVELQKAPMGMPPPKPFPITSMSGVIP